MLERVALHPSKMSENMNWEHHIHELHPLLLELPLYLIAEQVDLIASWMLAKRKM